MFRLENLNKDSEAKGLLLIPSLFFAWGDGKTEIGILWIWFVISFNFKIKSNDKE